MNIYLLVTLPNYKCCHMICKQNVSSEFMQLGWVYLDRGVAKRFASWSYPESILGSLGTDDGLKIWPRPLLLTRKLPVSRSVALAGVESAAFTGRTISARSSRPNCRSASISCSALPYSSLRHVCSILKVRSSSLPVVSMSMRSKRLLLDMPNRKTLF